MRIAVTQNYRKESDSGMAVEAFIAGRVKSPSAGCNHDHGDLGGDDHTNGGEQGTHMKRGTDGAAKKKTLRREIAIALAIKLLVLYGLWYAFFSHPSIHGMTEGMDPDRVAAALIAAPPANANEPREETRK